VAGQVGLTPEALLTGSELLEMRDEALWQNAARTTVFAEVDPNQKERIIMALRRTGHVVGYLGDGINDAPALHSADVGISVEGAADVARESADMVLLRHDLEVLRKGVLEGRRTFANTLKYVHITTSANFGNMVSMAAASLFLPFLPLLARQILLNNFLSDIPAVALASDEVDRTWVEAPRRWEVGPIQRFMIVFGLVSTLFDFLTFAVLLLVFAAGPEEFRSSWFTLSLLTELVILFVARTHGPFWKSRPSPGLIGAALGVAVVALALPSLGVGRYFEFVPLPAPVLGALILIVLGYAVASEVAKRWFFQMPVP
jgi:Mg2+-importing ATPase